MNWKRSVGVLLLITVIASGLSCSQQSLEEATSDAPEDPRILKVLHYQNEAIKPFTEIFKSFSAEKPHVQIEYDLTGGDQYETLLRSRFAVQESMDIVGVHPGVTDAITYARSGYLEDLSDQQFLQGIDKQFLNTGEYKGKYYGLPIDASYIVCLYNKRIFEEMNLSIPENWDGFIKICEELAAVSITPLALGLKDLWITQLIPYALAATTIYRNNSQFDENMYAGKSKFNDLEWVQTMEMYQQLQPFFNQNFLYTSYEQQLSLFAREESAMVVMGTWALPLIEEENSDLQYDAFVLPGAASGVNWTCYSVGGMLAINAASSEKVIAKQFLDYLMTNEVYYQYVSTSYNLPIKEGIQVDYHYVLGCLHDQMNGAGAYGFIDQGWPAGVKDVFMRGVQEMFAGKSIADVLMACDKEWASRLHSLEQRSE